MRASMHRVKTACERGTVHCIYVLRSNVNVSAKPAFPIYPLWWKVPRSFYRQLTKLAKKSARTELEILIEALNSLETNKAVKTVHPNWKSPSELAALRWAKTSPEERSAVGKRLARIRWERKAKSS